jgi:hypothetical protein
MLLLLVAEVSSIVARDFLSIVPLALWFSFFAVYLAGKQRQPSTRS